ncbi:MAG TPA: type II toxin-antitoxin system RelE/ParE family toxin [Rhizomicrobium sp.]
MKVVWSPTADRNADAVWEYIAQDNLDAADRILEAFRTSALQLERFPFLGRSGRIRKTRELVIPGTPYISYIALAAPRSMSHA